MKRAWALVCYSDEYVTGIGIYPTEDAAMDSKTILENPKFSTMDEYLEWLRGERRYEIFPVSVMENPEDNLMEVQSINSSNEKPRSYWQAELRKLIDLEKEFYRNLKEL